MGAGRDGWMQGMIDGRIQASMLGWWSVGGLAFKKLCLFVFFAPAQGKELKQELNTSPFPI